MYCADALVDAFTDARLVQIIRDGRDVVAAMLADPQSLGWFKPGMANVETEFPNPFFGIETEQDLGDLAGADHRRQVRHALARIGARHGQAACRHVRRAADHAAV